MVQAAFWRSPAFSLSRALAEASGAAGISAFWFAVLAWAAGCSGRTAVEEPTFAPAEVAQQAIRQYDKNGDGRLDAAELEKCPALLGVLNELDSTEEKNTQHKNGVLRAEEIQSRLEGFQTSHTPLVVVNCRVHLDGEPLDGATVTLVPEEFMGPAFKRAQGVSNAQGVVRLDTEGYDFPGVAAGYYRIEVSKRDAAGNETLPAQYNKQTILGREVSPLRRGGMGIKLELSSS